MKRVLVVVGVLLLIVGGVWILQGIDVLPGSFMTGRTEWAVYGAIAAAVGAALLLIGLRRRG